MRPPRALPSRLPSRRLAAALCCVALASSAAPAAAAVGAVRGANPTAAARVEITRFSPTGWITVRWRGNGHGHGMSQYGARGAAIKGLSASRILAFYYPGTRLARIAPSSIRVRLTNWAWSWTTVLNTAPGLSLSGVGALNVQRYDRFRLVPAGSGLTLQGRSPAGARHPFVWWTLRKGLPARADFSSRAGWVQLTNRDHSSIRYRGTVGAVRSGRGELTVNRLGLDQYVEGSVPREVPASWQSAAVRAQAIAARSYAETMRADAGSGSQYDICDTTSCQAYGGMAAYDRHGNLLWTDDPAALTGNANTVLRYHGSPVFAQYSASNGGATVDGGEPYLVGKSDPYDSTASGDPYLNESTKVRATSLARSFGLKSVGSVQITKRVGYGPWGGRVISAVVNGTNAAGKAAHVTASGFDLGAAFGVYTDYLRIGS
jgi:stage II sporulation protein D